MRFLFLVHGDRAAEAKLTPEERRAIVGEHLAFGTRLRERGAWVLGEALDDPATALVVQPGDPPLLVDGPYADTKEGVGGFYVVECESREEAVVLASQIPLSPGVAVEVLTIADL